MPRSYFTNLLKGRVESPGYEKMLAIAKAMGFPPEAWFVDGVGNEPEVDWGLAGALGDETIRETVREMSRLSKREKRLVLGIMRQFEHSGELLSGSLGGLERARESRNTQSSGLRFRALLAMAVICECNFMEPEVCPWRALDPRLTGVPHVRPSRGIPRSIYGVGFTLVAST